jgi:hypothetical protein
LQFAPWYLLYRSCIKSCLLLFIILILQQEELEKKKSPSFGHCKISVKEELTSSGMVTQKDRKVSPVSAILYFIRQSYNGKNNGESSDCHGPGDAEVHVAFKGEVPGEVHDGQYGGGNTAYGEDGWLFPVGEEETDACYVTGYAGSGKHIVVVENKGDDGKNECVFQ